MGVSRAAVEPPTGKPNSVFQFANGLGLI
jgi:hypothetical protein